MLRKLGLALFVLLLAAAGGFYTLISSFEPEHTDWQPTIGAAPSAAATPRADCEDRSVLRNAYFGDLHVHTAYSWDGAGRGMMTTPDQAYRFAKGEPLGLPPYDDDGNGLRSVQLERPLDFAAVTDHAESIGEVYMCITPGSARYGNDVCRAFRKEMRYKFYPKAISAMFAIRANIRAEEFCGSGAVECRAAALETWNITRQAAEDWYDRSSACSFTTFHGYEYTYAPSANRVHRNVIFRNDVVPELPVSAVDETEPDGLWRRLSDLCLETDGDCDVLAIPHNPNHSSGRMFPLSYPSVPLDARRERATLRAELEPLMEMMQIKGESECRNNLWGVVGAYDELCDLEKWEPLNSADDCEGEQGIGKSLGRGCVSRNDYARYAIAAGLQEQRELGVNPYRVGFIGSTDTHNGNPGDTEEWGWEGSTGLGSARLEQRLKLPVQRNPGGLVGVWAEENSRDALFDAMQRREVFATSGTRTTVRFFAGGEKLVAEDERGRGWCERPDALDNAYAAGVPMGGEVDGEDGTLWFALSAQRDPGTAERPGGLLQRMQVIKVRALEDGQFHQSIFDVAGGESGAGVDPLTCSPVGEGAESLCAIWQDPEFDPDESAAYYVRVVENPACKWTAWSCLNAPAGERPAMCDDPRMPELTQERAWSSPIWYQPAQPDR